MLKFWKTEKSQREKENGFIHLEEKDGQVAWSLKQCYPVTGPAIRQLCKHPITVLWLHQQAFGCCY